MIRIVILAAGTSQRMVGGVPKQLLKVNGEPLIRRTINQIKSITDPSDIWLVTRNEALKAECLDIQHFSFDGQTRCTCETLVKSKSLLTGKETLILLGDVMWTDDAILAIKQPTTTSSWYTDNRDVFGIRIANFVCDYAVSLAVDIANRNPLPNEGRLWNIFFELPDQLKEKREIGDATQDFDSQHDYEQFLAGITKNWILLNKGKS